MEKGLRHGQPGPTASWRHVTLRRAGATLLTASLLLSALPASAFLSSAAPLSWSEGTDAIVVDQPDDPTHRGESSLHRRGDSASSVRPRGREAPVILRQSAVAEADTDEGVGADPAPDPGDGPPPARKKNRASRRNNAQERRGNPNIRVWPMPAESYTFTQAFGCVPQIAHFYQPGAGCPPDRPVVHTGLDLAAPEGTPFYAAASGWVTESGYDREVGVANTRIIIQHEGRNDGYATEYLHWIASFVEVGDYVEAGQLIGEVGSVGYSTGPHLHFSVIDLDSGEHTDPARWLPNEPGTEGYRGITPRRAAMRLPAGTTAGVPEYADPAPPELPVREEVPETTDAGPAKKERSKRKKNKQREERSNRKASGKNREKDTRDVSGKDGSTSENTSPQSKDKKAKRERERTRKRERNRDGVADTNNASGTDGSGKSRKERRNKNADDNASGKNEKSEKRKSRKDDNVVEQTDTKDKGNKRNNNNGGGGGNGNKNNKQRQKDASPQGADETPPPVEETPPAGQGQADEGAPGQDDADGKNGTDNPNDGGQTEASPSDPGGDVSGDGNPSDDDAGASRESKRDRDRNNRGRGKGKAAAESGS